MKAIAKGETSVDFTPLLRQGKWGVLAVVVIVVAYLAFTNGFEVQIKAGRLSNPPVVPVASR
jgi:hypothetical protein